MNILVLCSEFPPETHGGASTFIFELSHGLIQNGINIHIITKTLKDNQEECIDNKLFIYRVACFNRHPCESLENSSLQNAKDRFKIINKARKVFNKNTIDFLLIIDCFQIREAISLKEQYRIPIIAVFQIVFFAEKYVPIKYRLARKNYNKLINEEALTINHADFIIANSCWTKNFLIKEYKLDHDKIVYIHNGSNFFLKTDFESKSLVTKFIDKYSLKSYKLLTFVGRLVEQKGVVELLSIAKLLINQKKNIKFLIVGKGELENYLIDLIRRENLSEYFLFLGFKDWHELLTIYKASNLLVMPSVYEPFGFVAIEAMAMGLPVIASNIGGLKEIIQNKKNGILINSLNDFEPDSKQFSIQILNLLENNSLYEKISKNARKRVLEHFSRDNMVQKYLIFLKTLTQFPPKGKSKTSLGIDCLT